MNEKLLTEIRNALYAILVIVFIAGSVVFFSFVHF